MVSNLIVVDFRQKRVIASPDQSDRENYMNILASELDEQDFQDIIDGINDPNYYKTLDPLLQDFVDGFFMQAG